MYQYWLINCDKSTEIRLIIGDTYMGSHHSVLLSLVICDSLSSVGQFCSNVVLAGATVIRRPDWPKMSKMTHSHSWQPAVQLEAVDLSIKDPLHVTSVHGLGFSQHGDWAPRGSTACTRKLQTQRPHSSVFSTLC